MADPSPIRVRAEQYLQYTTFASGQAEIKGAAIIKALLTLLTDAEGRIRQLEDEKSALEEND